MRTPPGSLLQTKLLAEVNALRMVLGKGTELDVPIPIEELVKYKKIK